ncbi:MAG: hypothetical protein AAB731_01410, partial [Patescibacteria group bacterium]
AVVSIPPPPPEEPLIVLPPEESPTTTPEVPPAIIRSGTDADSDGLTDAEEDMYKSNPFNPDTDGDNFIDGNEIFHLYSPIAATPATMLDSGLVSAYRNQKRGYALWYPIGWQTQSKDAEDREIDFIAPGGERVSFIVSDNPGNKSLENWYLATEANAKIEDIKPFTTKSGKSGIQSEDRFAAYFAKNGVIFTIKYNLDNRDNIEYRTTYGMMMRSLAY